MAITHYHTPEYKKRRFINKLHMIIRADDGSIIKEAKYPTAKKCSLDNLELLSDYQIVCRLVNNYKFSEYFTKYDCVTITKIHEVIPSELVRRPMIK